MLSENTCPAWCNLELRLKHIHSPGAERQPWEQYGQNEHGHPHCGIGAHFIPPQLLIVDTSERASAREDSALPCKPVWRGHSCPRRHRVAASAIVVVKQPGAPSHACEIRYSAPLLPSSFKTARCPTRSRSVRVSECRHIETVPRSQQGERPVYPRVFQELYAEIRQMSLELDAIFALKRNQQQN